MLTVDDYLRITDDQGRHDARMETYTKARQARHEAAALYAAEAALRTRSHYPEAASVAFEYDPRDGVTDLVVYDAEGDALTDDDDFEDQSEVTDMLTDAMDQERLFFGRPDGGVYTFKFAADLASLA